MFTYIDPAVRAELIARGQLVRIDGRGRPLEAQSTYPAESHGVNILGPIPLPLARPGLSLTVQWYAAVRSTELSRVEKPCPGFDPTGRAAPVLAAGLQHGGQQRVGSGYA